MFHRRPAWEIELRGGDYDGWSGSCHVAPQPVLVAWVCSRECDGHASFDVMNPAIVIKTAQSYRLVQTEDGKAIYEVGDLEPRERDEADELVGAGSDLGSGWPVSGA